MAVYLDHNATTPVDRRVVEAMLPYLQEHFGNPSSVYRRGRLARHAVEAAREQVAQLVNTHPSQVIFTSGGTEANNLAIKGGVPNIQRLAVSAIEHASVLEPARQVAANGGDFQLIGVDSEGRVTEKAMAQVLSRKPQLVSVMAANNETGVVQDISALADMVRSCGAIMHTDAVQMAGKEVLDVSQLGAQMISLSAHKIYGPKGAGALICDNRIALSPLLSGGGQESGYRAGTENVAAIVGFGKAAELAYGELVERQSKLMFLRKRLESALAQLDRVVVFSSEAKRLPNTVFFAVPGIDGETLLMELDRLAIEVSSGSACDSQKSGPSHVLVAMGVEKSVAQCAVRVSFGRDNTEADVDRLVSALRQQIENLKSTEVLAWV